jgi:hypothetical protein
LTASKSFHTSESRQDQALISHSSFLRSIEIVYEPCEKVLAIDNLTLALRLHHDLLTSILPCCERHGVWERGSVSGEVAMSWYYSTTFFCNG